MRNIMKKAITVALTLSFQFAAFAQISVNLSNTTVKNAMETLKKDYGYSFVFESGDVNTQKTISVRLQNGALDDAITQILQGQELSYEIRNKNIVVRRKDAASASQPQPRKKYSGVVEDDKGETIIGASVAVRGSQIGTATDADGRFSIEAPAGSTLTISYIGYTPQEIRLGENANLQIVLKEDAQALEEVVVVGYGVQKKRDLTGAITSVKISEMPVQSYSTVSHALAGKAAGLQVTQNSAQVGGGVTFRIRGETSTGAGNSPLVIIDGIPVSSTPSPGSGNRYNGGSTDNMLGSINPNDIESVEVLKDASATAIYGARAGHGVIIVTTKRGKNQKAAVTYSGNVAVQKVRNNLKMLDAKGFMTARNHGMYENYLRENALDVYKGYITLNPGHVAPAYVPMYSDEQIANAKGTDWLGEVMRDGLQHSHNISMTGGNEATQYMASANYFNQEGIFKNNAMDRFTAKVNLDQRISKYAKAGLTFHLSRNAYDNTQLGSGQTEVGGIIYAAMRFDPSLPVYDEKGVYTINPYQNFIPNPVSMLEIVDKTAKDRLLGSAYVEVEPVKGLLLKASLGIDRNNAKRKTYLPKTTMYGASVNGQASISEDDNNNYLMDLTATYVKTINQHSFTALAGYSYLENNSEGLHADNQDFTVDGFLYNNLGVGAYAKPGVSSGASKSSLGSYFARLNYSFLGRYLLTATVRADGASNFVPEYRWGYFPSVSAGWRFSDEAFMSSAASWLSNGKLRLGYGQTGNSNIGNRTLDSYGASTVYDAIFGDTNYKGIRATQLGNPRLKWETTSELNIGLDLGFLNNRINVTAEYYDRTISDLLSSKSLLSYHEVSSIGANIGKTKGNGFELTINTVNVATRDFEWTTDLSYSLYRDRWEERDPEWKPASYESEKDPIRAWFSYQSDGLLQPGERAPAHQPALLPGQVKIKDISGEDGVPDGKLNNFDMVYMGTSDPDFYFGFNNMFRYKGLDLNIYFYGEVNRLRGGSYYENWSVGTSAYNGSVRSLETWRHNNQTSTIPNNLLTSNYSVGDYYTKKYSFVRCRNITLGYTLPIPRTVFNRIRVYTDLNNPFVLTNWTGSDPETDEHNMPYPNITSFSLGVDITF